VVTQGELAGSGLQALTAGYGEAAATERAYLEQLAESLFGGGGDSLFGQIIGGLFGGGTNTGLSAEDYIALMRAAGAKI